MLSRLAAQLQDIRLSLRIRGARQREAQALARLGRAAMSAPVLREHAQFAPAVEPLERVHTAIAALRVARTASLEVDRAEFGLVEPWMRPAVVARGLLSRAILRHRIARTARSATPHYTALGALVADEPGLIQRLHLGSYLGDTIATARAELESARAERTRRLAPFGGEARAAWSDRLETESLALGQAIWAQLRSQLFPRASALAGLAVGWWIAHTFTDSHWKAGLRSLGIGSGGTHVVSHGTYRAMSFWLPLLAAAVCAYLCDRLAKALRQRHASARAELESAAAVADATMTDTDVVEPELVGR
ncbi:MAG TPA: hypothetical protein VFS33_01645 [Gemmatimonadales bacterium]|nr:hypothetical protein [Gemmatimonadales bacterium]